MKRIFLLLSLFLLMLINSWASDVELIKNDDGKIIQLNLDGHNSLKQFLKEAPVLEPDMMLKMIVAENLESKKEINELAAFIQKNGAGLETLHFDRKIKRNRGLGEKDLLIVLKAISQIPLKSFKWENQDKIKTASLGIQFTQLKTFWSQLEELSFNGTRIDPKTFFLHYPKFEHLQILDVSNTKINSENVYALTQKPENFPVMENFYCEGIQLKNIYEIKIGNWQSDFDHSEVFNQFNLFRDNEDKITYLHLQGKEDVKKLMENNRILEAKMELKTLVVKELKGDDEFILLMDFIVKNGKNLDNLHFYGKPMEKKNLESKQLMLLLPKIAAFPLKSFKWEYQNKIAGKNRSKLAQYGNLWSSIEDLSFKGTNVSGLSGFFANQSFNQLIRFNVSHSDLTIGNFFQFFKAANNFPLLEELYCDGVKLQLHEQLSKYNAEMPFNHLKVFSFNSEKISLSRYGIFVKSNKPVIDNLDAFYYYHQCKNKKDKLKNDGQFIVDKELKTNNNIGLYADDLNSMGSLKNIGRFIRYSKGIQDVVPELYKNNSDAGYFLANGSDIRIFIQNKNDLGFTDLILATDQIKAGYIHELLEADDAIPGIRNIYLVQSAISEKDLIKYRKLAATKNIRIHLVAKKPATGRAESYLDGLHQMHMQQMQQWHHDMFMQHMQQSMQQNIPKFK